MIGNKLTLFVVRLKYYDLRPVVVNLLFGFEKCLLTKQNLLTTCPTLLLLLLICFLDFLRHSWGLSANNGQVIIYLGRRHDVTVHTLHR